MSRKEKNAGIVFEPRRKLNHKPDSHINYDTIIIGSGVAGLAAAMYSARLGLKTLVTGELPGGTLALSGAVENYPGFVSIDGQKLTQLLHNHAMDYDVHFLTDRVDRISKAKAYKTIFLVQSGKKSFRAKTIILATGSQVKKLNVPGEDEFFGKGVDYCALCDATFYKGKIVAVVGGGDSAVKEANLLTAYARKVYIINNEENLHPEHSNEKILQEHIRKGRIEAVNSNGVKEIRGTSRVEKIILNTSHNGASELRVDGVFIYIGHTPLSQLAKMVGVKLNKTGEVMINRNSETNVPGFLAAGDVTDLDWKQAIMAAAQGVAAAYHVYGYLSKRR
jgi:thioredoxin reductase (NADPH)